MLSPALLAASVALQLPPERQPAEPSWGSAGTIAAVLTSAGMQRVANERLVSPASSARMLQATVQLVQLAADSSVDETLYNMSQRLHACASCMQLALLACREEQPGTDQLWKMLPGLPSMLRQAVLAVSGSPDGIVTNACLTAVAGVCIGCRSICARLSSWYMETPPSSRRSDEASLLAHAEAVSALTQALPAIAAAVERQRQLEDQSALVWATGFVANLFALATTTAVTLGSAIRAGQVQRAAGMASAWQMHTAVCRVVHWLLSGAGQQLLPAVQLEFAGLLSACLEGCMQAAYAAAGNRQAPEPLQTRQQLYAMHAAHAEALRALLASSGPVNRASTVLLSLAYALEPGLPAVVLQPGICDCFTRLLDQAPQVGGRGPAAWVLEQLSASVTFNPVGESFCVAGCQ